LLVEPPNGEELNEILERTTTDRHPEAGVVFVGDAGREAIAEMRRLVRHVVIAPPLQQFVVSLVAAATPNGTGSIPAVRNYVRFGPGPRAAQAVVLGAKVNALLDGRAHTSFGDITDVVLPALRHRLILNFQAEAENVTTDSLIGEVMRSVRRP
jgi:MoxR-like ATPase